MVFVMKVDLIELPLPLDTFSLFFLVIKSNSLKELITLILIAVLHACITFIPIIILNHIMSLLIYYQATEGIGLIIFISTIVVISIIMISIVKIKLQVGIISRIRNLAILGMSCRVLLLGHLIKLNSIINQVYQYKYNIEELITALILIGFNGISMLIFTLAIGIKSYIAGVIVLLYEVVIIVGVIILAKFSYKIQQKYIEMTSKLYSYNFEVINGIVKVITNNIQLEVINKVKSILFDKTIMFKKFILILQWQNVLFISLSLTLQVILYIVLYLSDVQISDIIFVNIVSSQALWLTVSISNNLRSIYIFGSKIEGIQILEKIKQEKNNMLDINHQLSGQVKLINLSFKHKKSDLCILNKINLIIYAKTIICIQGKSGVGKTTLIRIITGFDQASSGVVSFDNYHLDNASKKNFRQQMGIILQNHNFLYGSIRDIVAGGQKITDKEIHHYLLLADFQSDLSKLNLNLDTILNFDSIKLSKGQQQKLMIAQALAKVPKILVLDEALSAVDNHSYCKILDNIRNLQVTTIFITHREQNQDIFDKIYILMNGELIDKTAC